MNDEKDRRLYEELSAYLDGESGDADKMAALLQNDSAAARQYLEMAKLSAHLRALPAPDVHPAFATRVLAHIREGAPAPRRSRRWAWTAGLFAAAALVALVVFPTRAPQAPAPADNAGIAARVLQLSKQPDETLRQQFDGLLADGALTEYGDTSEDAAGNDYLAQNENTDLSDTAVLASISALDRDEPSYTDDSDMDTQLESMSDSELQALRVLLTDYAERGT